MTAKAQARSQIAAAADQPLELSHRIHAHPETAWQEHRAAGWLTDALDRLGYAVTCGACQLPTAFTASVGTGGLHIVICAEYDVLPGLGHACGHNIIAAAVLPCTSVVAATQNTVATVLRYRSMARPPAMESRRSPNSEQHVDGNLVSNSSMPRQIRTRRSETSVGQKYYYLGRI